MKSKNQYFFLMIDAYGWEIQSRYPILQSFEYRSKLRSVFGYSSACIPSILTGRNPEETHNWCYYYLSPETSPFKELTSLRHIPSFISDKRRVRNLMTKFVKKRLGFNGYFDLYNVPFSDIHKMDFSEKKSPLLPGGINRGDSIFDKLVENQIPYFVSDPSKSEEDNHASLINSIQTDKHRWNFCYWPGLDGLMHRVGNTSEDIRTKMLTYEQWIHSVMNKSRESGFNPVVYVFSDHGMANLKKTIHPFDLFSKTSFQPGKDFEWVIDSTMLRIWPKNHDTEKKVIGFLDSLDCGRVIEDEELMDLGTYFPDNKFGNIIFLLNEGNQFGPSHMGRKAMTGMHGYHPDDTQSNATLITNDGSVGSETACIKDIFHLMTACFPDILGNSNVHPRNIDQPARHQVQEVVSLD